VPLFDEVFKQICTEKPKRFYKEDDVIPPEQSRINSKKFENIIKVLYKPSRK
jgi:hypothetical protein